MVGVSINGDNVKVGCVIGVGSDRSMGNQGTSASSSSRAESSWCLNEMTEGAITIEVGSLFQYFTTRFEKDDFLRRRRLGPCRALKGCPLKPGRTAGIKKGLGPRSNPPENILYAEATPVSGV